MQSTLYNDRECMSYVRFRSRASDGFINCALAKERERSTVVFPSGSVTIGFDRYICLNLIMYCLEVSSAVPVCWLVVCKTRLSFSSTTSVIQQHSY